MGAVIQTDRIKHLKGRDFEVPMSGAAYLTSFNPELTDHFDVGREILCYASESECAEVLSFVLRRPELLVELRRAARARCLRDHTWERRVRELYDLFD
jgi:spore maturation protein CgeB